MSKKEVAKTGEKTFFHAFEKCSAFFKRKRKRKMLSMESKGTNIITLRPMITASNAE